MVMSALKTSNMPWTLDKSKPNCLYATSGETRIDGDVMRCQIPPYRCCHTAYLPLNSLLWSSDAHDCLHLRLLDVVIMIISYLLPCGPSPKSSWCWHCCWGRPQPFLFSRSPRLPPTSQAGRLHSFPGPRHPPRGSLVLSRSWHPRRGCFFHANGAGFLCAFSTGWSNNSTCMYWVLTVFQAMSNGKQRPKTSLRKGILVAV